MEATTDFKEEPTGKIFAEFSRPKTIDEPVIVSRYLPDNTTEQIGCIYYGYNEDDNMVFTCVDRNGKMLFPPTLDYSNAEERFEAYSKKLTVKAIDEQTKRGQGFLDRVTELQNVRNNKEHGKDKNIKR